ncbi:hypothetical protein [Candidatus Palauibacter sp.]|uniref:hypothetical protein n=1 Tax=Candidatus Palauibacter sp. TaxID=3101350 RepID=UPI003B026DB7
MYCFNLLYPSKFLVTPRKIAAWLITRTALGVRPVHRAVASVLLASVLASFVPSPVGATTHADSHPSALVPDEAAAATAAQGACAPYVSGGPGNPAIGSLSGSDCMNFGTPWIFGGCELCFCFYDVEFGNGDDGTYATWAVDCSFA